MQILIFCLCILQIFDLLQENKEDGIGFEQLVQTDLSYNSLKEEIRNARAKLHQDIPHDSVSTLCTEYLVNKLIPHWLSTPWSFEGHTSIPGTGEIACGYFVSTTLLHMGFNLNRYKFAQQLPINETKTLNLGDPIMEINSTSKEERIKQLKSNLKEGIHFIGFDQSHVGYIYKKDGQLFVIHSNYINAEGVVIERIEESQVFSYYTHLYIAEISTNRVLMKKWLTNSPIKIITP